uniref:Uncharacterized protein n=1 Tax=Trypanosoma congolense (strain IL3000) TaxID=1068625 RepID=G0UX92_TRYCI|nr:conserved hypothetical protein [Trypanosoma congolense IL3000]
MAAKFTILCEELGRLQVRMLRREGNPENIAMEAIQALRSSRDAIVPTRQNMAHAPFFLRSCSTLLGRGTRDQAHDVFAYAERVAEAYVDGNHGDVNDSATVLQSLVQLSRTYHENTKNVDSSVTVMPSPFAPLVATAFLNTLQKWQKHGVRPHTSTLLSLLRGSNAVYGEKFQFNPVGADMVGLLPIKSKLQMEAKMQKCNYSRDILRALCSMHMSKLDAGICLTWQADFGLYDSELCNVCCEVLFSNHALLTSQQLTKIIHSLGVLQHRHIHQKFFSSLVDFKKCNAAAVRQHVMGLAMLRQPPPSERGLMDGVFLHVFRPTDPLEYDSSPEAALSPGWFVDIGHALTCLGITHHKYRLTMARATRRSIMSLTTQQRCKLLYGLGGVTEDAVPRELLASWKGKVVRTIHVLAERLRNGVESSDGPFVMNALLFAGIREHPMVPQQPSLGSGENPVETLLRTWMTCPRERVLYLTEQIRPIHLGNKPASTISQVCDVIANNCGGVCDQSYRLKALCDVIRSHSPSMNVDEAMGTINAMQQLGIGENFRDVIVTLLESLWRQRNTMSQQQQANCCRLLEGLGHLDTAVNLLEYIVSK